MFSFFNREDTPLDNSRFSSCSLLKGLLEILTELRTQADKLKKEVGEKESSDNITLQKYLELKKLLNKVDTAILDFNNVPECARNELQDVKLLTEAIISAIKQVKMEIVNTQRGFSTNDLKQSGVSLISLAPLAFYSVGALSGPFALAGSVVVLGAGTTAVSSQESITKSVEIILKLQEFSVSLLKKVDESLEFIQKTLYPYSC